MTRLELQPTETVNDQLNKLLKDIEQIKTAQAIGKDSLRPQIVQSDDAWDIEAEKDLFNPPFYYEINETVRYVADNQPNPYMGVAVEFYELDGSVYPTSDITNYNINQLRPGSMQHFHDDYTDRFQLVIRGLTTRAFRIKIFLLVSDRGTMIIGG